MVRSDIRRSKKFDGRDSRVQTFRAHKRRGWDIVADVSTFPPVFLPLTGPLVPIPRKGTVKLLEIEITFGPLQNMVSHRTRWAFALLEMDEAPDDLFEQAIWSSASAWRAESNIGVYQTMSQADVDLSRAPETQRRTDNGKTEIGYHLVCRSDTATITVATTGVVTWKEKLFQKTWVDDFSEWDGYTFEESAS